MNTLIVVLLVVICLGASCVFMCVWVSNFVASRSSKPAASPITQQELENKAWDLNILSSILSEKY